MRFCWYFLIPILIKPWMPYPTTDDNSRVYFAILHQVCTFKLSQNDQHIKQVRCCQNLIHFFILIRY